MTAIPQIRKAEKRQVKIKIGIQGPSGGGKTWSALALATNLWPNEKILLVDTENESASLYADHFNFDTIPLNPPFTTERYLSCIEAAVSGGYGVLIIDSVSHQWSGTGGILERKAEADSRPGSNSYINWNKFTPEHTEFVEAIKQSPIHIIATMRSKQDYALQDNDKGKKQPVKLGLAPIQRDGFDYEFSLIFDLQMDHLAKVDKNRTGLFEKQTLNLADKAVADELRAWLESGKKPDTDSPIAKKAEVSNEAPTGLPPSSNGKHSAQVILDSVSVGKSKAGKEVMRITIKGGGEFALWDKAGFERMATLAMQHAEVGVDYREKTVGGRTYRDIQEFWPINKAHESISDATAALFAGEEGGDTF